MRSYFSAEVEPAHSAKEALAALKAQPYDLILVNRLLDRDGAPGVDIIRQVKAEKALAGVPIMLVSNYPHAQMEAQTAGALPGFGKAQLGEAETVDKVRRALEKDQ
jgi:DNA-binding response OmpR family regulator